MLWYVNIVINFLYEECFIGKQQELGTNIYLGFNARSRVPSDVIISTDHTHDSGIEPLPNEVYYKCPERCINVHGVSVDCK